MSQFHKVTAAQPISKMCLVCGLENQIGLKAQFLELENGELAGVFTPREELQGYPGRLHGGIATTILDETIGRVITATDPEVWGVTIELSVKFRQPVPLDREVRAVGRITRNASRIFEGEGEIVLEDGTVAVEGTGKYMKLPIEKIANLEFADDEWGPDARPVRGEIELG